MKNSGANVDPRGEHQKRFEEFARAVFSVPKREIDRAQAAYQRQKEKRKKGHGRSSGSSQPSA